jgi:hypothetical protein
VIALALLAAALHVGIGLRHPEVTLYDVINLAAAVAFVSLTLAMFVPLPFLPKDRSGLRAVFVTYAFAHVMLPLVTQDFTTLTVLAIFVLIALIVALGVEGRRTAPVDEPLGERPSVHS